MMYIYSLAPRQMADVMSLQSGSLYLFSVLGAGIASLAGTLIPVSIGHMPLTLRLRLGLSQKAQIYQ